MLITTLKAYTREMQERDDVRGEGGRDDVRGEGGRDDVRGEGGRGRGGARERGMM